MAEAVAVPHKGQNEKLVIAASSLGTVFEWYDFYLYGSLAAIIAKQFFAGLDPTSAFIFALFAFAAGFIVRPFGALFFGAAGFGLTFFLGALFLGLALGLGADRGVGNRVELLRLLLGRKRAAREAGERLAEANSAERRSSRPVGIWARPEPKPIAIVSLRPDALRAAFRRSLYGLPSENFSGSSGTSGVSIASNSPVVMASACSRMCLSTWVRRMRCDTISGSRRRSR